MPRNRHTKPRHLVRTILLSPFHDDILRGFMAAWNVTDAVAIASVLHAVYATIETQAQHTSPINKSLTTILRKVHAAQAAANRKPSNPDAYLERQ